VHLARLVLDQFRNYAQADLELDPGLTLVTGPNGAGKTNLLEAIWVAVAGRSPRAASDGELVRHGAEWARLDLQFTGPTAADRARLEVVIPGPAAPPDARRLLTVNGIARRQSTVNELARAVLFRPEEMLLLVGSPVDRRRFLDTIVAQRSRPGAADLADLARILHQRNALLRAVRAEEADASTLGFWDEQLADVGGRVMSLRLSLVADLNELIGPLHDAVAPPDEAADRVGVAYLDTLKDAWPDRRPGPVEAAELTDALRRRLAGARDKEVWNGASLVGPQRDDLQAELANLPVAAHASRGQQRTLILALKLAETELIGRDGPRPIVLLDDVFSELDAVRAGRALGLLRERGQILVTSADPAVLPKRQRHQVPVWTVGEGRLVMAPRVA
jgi:DNA replication and repair protein RecF